MLLNKFLQKTGATLRRNTKTYRTITVYNQGKSIRERLKEIGAVWSERDISDRFFGVEFKIARPKGKKGAMAKCREIDEI